MPRLVRPSPLLLAAMALATPRRGCAQTDTLRYTFTYEAAAGRAPRLAVDVEFRGDPSGRTRIVRPTTWAGETGLGDAISGFEAGPGVRIGPDSAGVRVLTHRRGARVHLHYLLHQDWTGPLRYPLFQRVVLDGTRVAFNQTTALVYPEHAPRASLVLQYQWRGLPHDWRILTSFGAKARFSGAVTWREFSSAFFSAGAFRLVASPRAMGGMTIETQGRWSFGDPALARLVGTLWRAETGFWGASAFPRPFVLLLPMTGGGTVAGTAFTAGFFAVADTAADLKVLGRLLAHELFHLWNGQRMGPTTNEAWYKWFGEGFTEYYADRIFRRIGQYSDSEYRGRVNAELRAYYTSPVRGSPLGAVAARYWTDSTYQRYPYAQGYVLALYLQHELPAWTGSRFDLDSLMVQAYRRFGGRGVGLTMAGLTSTVPADGRGAFASAIAEYIERGTTIPALPQALGRCTVVRTEPVRVFVSGGAATVPVPQYEPVRGAPGCISLGG